MFIPSTFELGGLTWTVKFVKKFPDKLVQGECDIVTTTIKVKSTLSQEMKEQTFCHELVHAIKFAMGIAEQDHNEVDVDAFAMYLHQFLKTAKW